MTQIRTLVTHNGAFHADDVLAYALLSELNPAASLLRTRDADRIAATQAAIVFDVGDVYDPAQGRYDHHQPGRACRADGLPYSSFGLVWHHFGRAWLCLLDRISLADAEALEALHARIDRELVRPIDMLDNGAMALDIPEAARSTEILGPMALPGLLGLFRPPSGQICQSAEDAAFREAAAMAALILRRWAEKTAETLATEHVVAAALAQRHDPRWVELGQMGGFPGYSLAEAAPDLLYAIMPGRDEWQLSAVNTAANSFDLRAPLPQDWAGLRGDALVAATGVADAVFCHAGRFCAFARSREGVMRLLEIALDRLPE